MRPERVFLVKNLTGFGDEVVSTKSEKFRLDELR